MCAGMFRVQIIFLYFLLMHHIALVEVGDNILYNLVLSFNKWSKNLDERSRRRGFLWGNIKRDSRVRQYKGIGAVAYLRTVGPESAVAFLAGTAEGSILFTRWRQCAHPTNTLFLFAFRPNGSTTCALVHLFRHVTQMLETNSYMFVACPLTSVKFLMLIVNRKVPLHKLDARTLLSNIHDCVISFLTGRQQKCVVSGS